jgi:hypothetical protein
MMVVRTRPDWPTLEEVRACDNVETMLRWNRFLPPPQIEYHVNVIKEVVKRLQELRALEPGAYVAASKNLGWDTP